MCTYVLTDKYDTIVQETFMKGEGRLMHDVIIIGGGPSGFTAALYCARANLDTLLIEKMFSGGQMATTSMMENYPGFEEPIGGSDLAMRMEKQALKFGARVVKEEVGELSLEGNIKTVKTNNNAYQTRAIILCMGASPRELGLPREKELRGAGVSYCATCDGSFYKGRTVAVVGGGDTAAEDAIYLSRICDKIHIVHRRDELRAVKALQNELFNNKKVEFVWDSVVEEIEGKFDVEGIKVRNVKTNELKSIKVDGVFVAVGTSPNTALVKGKVDLSGAGYIVTDEKMQTNIRGVFAAGDIREKVLRQVVTAASDGAVAAYMAERYIGETG
jgi:thioredoxin reductase (NADPH)